MSLQGLQPDDSRTVITAEQKLQEDLAVAEQVMAARFGGKVRLALGDKEGLNRRDYVHRLNVVQGPPEAPQTLIMKQARRRADQPYASDEAEGPASRLFDEWAGLQFLGEVGGDSPLAPRLYGGDRDAGILLMEDFGTGMRLDHALLGQDAAVAAHTLVALSRTVGRMHAQTLGKQARYEELRTVLGPTTKPSRQSTRRDLEGVRHSLQAIGLVPRQEFYKECETVLAMLDDPGPFCAYLHSDPCPDNCHWVGPDLRLLDFEGGTYGHALLEGVYPRIHFPTCWCVSRLPDEVMRNAEEAYRAALLKGCPQAADDGVFGPAVVGTCAYWAFTRLVNSLPGILEEDRPTDLGTARQRIILRFELSASAADEFGCLKAIGETAHRVVTTLRSRWQDAGEMPYYPAFQAQR